MDNLIAVFIFIFGAIVGSFLNVCIVRLPHQKSIVVPNSHCVHCKQLISWHDNVPLLSYWILGGKCRICKAKISIRYFIVELLTAILFLIFYLQFGLDPVLWPYLIFLGGLIVATFIDLEHRIIPDEISIGGMYVGFACSLLVPALHAGTIPNLLWGRLLMRILVGICALAMISDFLTKKEKLDKDDLKFFLFIGIVLGMDLIIERVFPAPQEAQGLARNILALDASLVGAMVGGGAIYAMGLLGDFLFKKESMGGGDVKLMAMIGAFLGWPLVILSFFVAPFFGAVYGIVEKIRTKDSAIAYGPFLSIGALVCLFWGGDILNWILIQPFNF